MKILVCGGRDYDDYAAVCKHLGQAYEAVDVTMVIQGGARGADALAARWANEHNIHCAWVPAIWRPNGVFDKAAGPKRNRSMLTLGPDVVYAFPGGSGTADMVRAAKFSGIPVKVVA